MRSIHSLALVLGGVLLSGVAHAIEIRKWERVPMAIPLVVGQERILFVDANVRVGVPPAIADKIRVQSTGGAIYLLAKEPIEPSRLQLQNAATGEIVLADIAATPAQEGHAPLEAIKIVPGDTTPTRYGQAASTSGSNAPKATAKASSQADEDDDEPAPPKRETPIPVVLTRYAAQMLYAPLRTVEPVDGVSQVKVDKRLDLSTLMPALPVEASQLGAWRLDDHWVTAVKLRNQTGQRLALDPRELMGDFATATFQHPYLGARGDASDTTVLYLVTKDHGLSQSLLPSLSAADPRVSPEARHAAQK